MIIHLNHNIRCNTGVQNGMPFIGKYVNATALIVNTNLNRAGYYTGNKIKQGNFLLY
jgi:hypothetical protein